MFLKSNNPPAGNTAVVSKKDNAIPSIITRDMHILGNIVSEGVVDFDGTLDGNIRCSVLTLRGNGSIKGEITANSVLIYGKVKGLIRAKNVQLYSSCNVEGIIMHETIAIEDGAFVDGKFKRADRISTGETEDAEDAKYLFDSSSEDAKILENIRLIR